MLPPVSNSSIGQAKFVVNTASDSGSTITEIFFVRSVNRVLFNNLDAGDADGARAFLNI